MTTGGQLPSSGAGAVYDGDGSLVAGEGPVFSVELVADLAFQAVVHAQDEPSTSMDANDRLWILPERSWASLSIPEHLLATLAGTVRAGRKVLIAAHDTEVGDHACEAIEQMLGAAHGMA